MQFLRIPTDIIHLWMYCISGVATVIFLMIMICYLACRQEYSDRAARRRVKRLHLTTIQNWQQQVNSYPDLSHRPASDILLELDSNRQTTESSTNIEIQNNYTKTI